MDTPSYPSGSPASNAAGSGDDARQAGMHAVTDATVHGAREERTGATSISTEAAGPLNLLGGADFAEFADLIPTLAWIANADGFIVWYNRRWYEYTGKSPAEMEGWGWQSVHDAQRLPAVLEAWTHSIQTGERFEMVFPLRGGDGIFRTFLTRVHPVRDAAGRILRWFGTNTEIEEVEQDRRAMQQSEAQFREIAEGLPQLVWTANPEGALEWFSQRWYAYSGATFEQSRGSGWASFLHPADLERTAARWEHSLRTGDLYETQFRCRRADGVYRWFDVSAQALRDEKGSIVRWFGTCSDIDAQKVAEAERRQLEDRMRVALANVPLLVYTVDRGLRYTWVHAPHRTHPLLDLIGRRDQDLSASELTELIRFKQEALAAGRPIRRIVSMVVEGRQQIHDLTAEPQRDDNGEVCGLIVASLDITEHVWEQQQLREKTELMDLAQSAVSAGYWSFLPASGEYYFSPGQLLLFGLSSGSRIRAGAVADITHPEDRERVAQTFAEGIASGFYLCEFRVLKPDGSFRWLESQGRMLRNSRGQPYMVGLTIDISTQKKTAEALRRNEKLAVAGRLAATIAHEINNPLESVTNLLYLIRHTSADEGSRAYAQTAEEELSRVTQIVTQSLRFHRQSTTPTSELVSSILESAAAIYRSRLGSDGTTVERDLRDRTPVRCFSSELRQVFGNLIGNSFDATRNGGRIVLRTREITQSRSGRRGIHVSIADDGHGMDQTTQRRLFEPFFTTKGINGTGLGLWISKEILTNHEATLRVRSRQGPGLHGTVFSIFLPFNANVSRSGDSTLL